MPALFFPNLNALRLALTSRLVPQAITHAPTAAGFDSHDRLWLELAELPPRESLAALARLGIQALGGAGVSTEPVSCWAELLPLRVVPQASPGSVLFLVPERKLARFAARLRRSSVKATGIALPDDPAGFAWLLADVPPLSLLREIDEANSEIAAFWEQAPGVWVPYGWCHVVVDQVVCPPGRVVFIRPPRSVQVLTEQVPRLAADEFRLPRARRQPLATQAAPPIIPTRLTLVPRPTALREAMWVFRDEGIAEFWEYCAAAEERVIHRLEAGVVAADGNVRLVVRTVGKRPVVLPLPGNGYAPDPRAQGLFIPANRRLRPVLRVRELGRALGVAPDRLVWLEATGEGSVVPHAVPLGAFRPVAGFIEYTTPARVNLAVLPRTDPFPFDRLQPPVDAAPIPEPETVLDLASDEVEATTQPEGVTDAGWLWRSLRKLVARLRPGREVHPEFSPGEQPESESTAPTLRVERKLESADALLHGHDWPARRGELESRLVRELPRVGPEPRATLWANLAAVYSSTGNFTDGAVCWMNAIWESPAPPVPWFEHWLMSECRAAKLMDHTGGLERWLSEPGRPGIGRIVAAYTALAGLGSVPTAEFLAELPRILAFLDQHFEDLPLRAAWLARLAATRVCNGDALGLARWGDRVALRLNARGPGLDLDEPSFLRFHGTVSADRFQAARDWLIRLRDPILNWVQKQGRGRLRESGLDAETDATAAYAQFMLAWGLGCLGERTRAKDWAARARKELRHRVAPGVATSPHAVLGDLFLQRVRDAQEGRMPKPGLPGELQSRVEALAYLDRYAVDKLREYSRILEPADRVRAFRGLETKVFWGNDRLGERLFVLAGRTDPPTVADEADALLQLCSANPTTETVPRIVLTLIELAPLLDVPVVRGLLELLPAALDWTEAWLAVGPWRDDERPRKLVDYQARLIEAGFAATACLPASGMAPAVGALLRRLLASGESVRVACLTVATSVFRILRRFGFQGEAESLVRFLVPGRSDRNDDHRYPRERLSLAMGWFTAGNEDAGNRLLNTAREMLFTLDRPTELALAYAEALGFAPARIAHGRLEEIFQRLGAIGVMGSTNRYFTLQPLQLIDAVVRSVVTDEFTLSPSVRVWLADDEFLIRGRVSRDLNAVLREQGIG